MNKTKKCGDYGVRLGEYHKKGCDIARCPICKRQYLTCPCDAAKIKFTGKEFD